MATHGILIEKLVHRKCIENAWTATSDMKSKKQKDPKAQTVSGTVGIHVLES